MKNRKEFYGICILTLKSSLNTDFQIVVVFFFHLNDVIFQLNFPKNNQNHKKLLFCLNERLLLVFFFVFETCWKTR